MCIAIPGKLVEKKGENGIVDIGGVNKEVSLTFIPEIEEGQWMIIHTGFGLNIISEEDALETLKIFEEMESYGT